MKKQHRVTYRLNREGVKVFVLLLKHLNSCDKSSKFLRKYYRGVAYEKVKS